MDIFCTIRDEKAFDEDLPPLHPNSRLSTTRAAMTDKFAEMEDKLWARVC